MPEPTLLAALSPSERHRSVAQRFSMVVEATSDWQAATPVAGWVAQDIVRHLVEWFPAFLATGGVELPDGPTVDTDPTGAWQVQTEAVQALLDDKKAAASTFTHPHAGTHQLDEAIDRFYTADVFMHTWDLATATGTEPELDPDFCTVLVAGMEPIEALLRSSGQYGLRFQVADDAAAMTRLIGFIGRDPNWTRPH